MKILFKNITKYTKENTDSFVEFHSDKYGKKELIKIILFGICLIYILLFNLINKNWLFVLVATVIGVMIFFIEKIEYQKKEKKEKKEKEFTFYFYEKHIKIKCKRSFERLKYFQLHKIFETDKYFFLYTDEKSSLILSKDGFEVGTANGFAKFIKNKCPFKYRKENKKKEK